MEFVMKKILYFLLAYCLIFFALKGWAQNSNQAIAIFAGGCFWCVEADFDKVKGVIHTTSGYIGGQLASPTYAQVSKGGTGHYEAVKIIYDPAVVSYQTLLE